jgi:hypothetical protein
MLNMTQIDGRWFPESRPGRYRTEAYVGEPGAVRPYAEVGSGEDPVGPSSGEIAKGASTKG